MTKQSIQESHQKRKIAMRAYLSGKEYYSALKAMALVEEIEVGFRKDGETPKFDHQLKVVEILATLEPWFIFPQETLTVGFLHDVLEDHGERYSTSDLNARFGNTVGYAVWVLSKKNQGMVRTPEAYFEGLGLGPITSLVKLADRAHNISTMIGAFSDEKQLQYAEEVEKYFHPMAKRARKQFPSQYQAYQNLLMILNLQVDLIKARIQ